VMHGHGKPDSVIVTKKLTNKAGQPVAERRTETDGKRNSKTPAGHRSG
jgi:hypothetical protein